MRDRSIQSVLTSDRGCGVHEVSRAEYDALDALNQSSLKEGLLGSSDLDPVAIKEAFERQRICPSQDMQDSFDKGTLAHLILLQPELVVDRVAVWTGGVRHGRAWDEFKIASNDKLVMRSKDISDVQTACRAFRSVSEVNYLLRPCNTEIVVTTREGGIHCKAQIDAVTRAGECVLFDLKTTANGIDSASVSRTIRKYKYREQLGIYKRWYEAATGRMIDSVYLIFVALPPQRIGIRLVKLTTSALQFGEARMLSALKSVEKCLERNEWPIFFANDICDVNEWELGAIDLDGIDA